jgi:N-acetylglucosaminyldiphosphoundecaprenol N-acetyl-beta-D-mannosaminyltransferase
VKVNILGVLIDNLSKSEVLKKVEQFLINDSQSQRPSLIRANGRIQHYIVTPNPEIVVAAQKDKEFLEILNRADLAVPDGVGLIFASQYLRQPLQERVTGVDLMKEICHLAEQKNYSVYFLGGEEGVARKTADTLQKQFPQLQVAGAESGGVIEISDFRFKISDLLEKINNTKPDILFVAFGAIKQEKWIAENLKQLPSVKISMGVGGAFDFIAGKIKRAPRWMRRIGLEWLWRLFMQPWRWKRILTATVKFSWMIIKSGKKYA